MYSRFFKRFFDILLSFLAIIVLAFPMLVIAIAVKCDSKGPAIFVQDRIGRNGKPFRFYKFRSMTTDAPKDVATRKIQSQCYITKLGAFLRKTSLDELPQLFCILKGDMSIIGPRPVVSSETELLEYRRQAGVERVRPGLTGWAQVNGRDQLTDMKLKAMYDAEYANNITFWKDIKILFKTVATVFTEAGIVEGDAVMNERAEYAKSQDEQLETEILEEAAIATGDECVELGESVIKEALEERPAEPETAV